MTRCRTSATSRSATSARSGAPIAHADPASDLPACLLALDAELVIRSANGERTIPIDGFFEGPFTTGLGPGEILTEIRLPGPRDDAGSAYATLQQPASGYALVGVAAVVFSNGSGGIAGANVALTGVGEMAYRARAVEAALAGSDGSTDSIAAAAAHATDGVDVRATSTPTVNIAPRWRPSIRAARSRLPSLGCADRPAGIACRSNASRRGSVPCAPRRGDPRA